VQEICIDVTPLFVYIRFCNSLPYSACSKQRSWEGGRHLEYEIAPLHEVFRFGLPLIFTLLVMTSAHANMDIDDSQTREKLLCT
jgi:hypothetical protein